MSKAADDLEVTIQPDMGRVSTALSRPLTFPSWNARSLNLPALRRHGDAIRAKPESEWTPEEQQFMSDGEKWAVEAFGALAQAFQPMIEGMTEAFVALARAIVGAASQQAGSRQLDSPYWPDAHRHVEGLPGVSNKCWADKWIASIGDYRVCNAKAVNELGTCEEHQL